MTTIPRTTKLGPAQSQLRELLRRLADAEARDARILSVYADVRPETHGERPGERPQLITIRDRLRAIGDAMQGHGPERESFDADVRRIERVLAAEDLSGVDGLAIFACDRIGLWEVVRTDEPLTSQVTARPTADLFPLARLLADSVSGVVAVVDSNTCRLFVTRRGDLQERGGPDEPVDEHRRHDQGGWSQARFQRHVDMQDKRFAAEAAAAIERLLAEERAAHLILAGDERITPILEAELSERARSLLAHVIPLEMRSTPAEVQAEVGPILAAIEAAEAEDLADLAIGEWRAGDLGTVGIDGTRKALEWGQVDRLVIDEAADIPDEVRAELVQRAAQTDAQVEVVRDHPGLAKHGGVAATLRFRV
jgi:peptide chain release factor subunit 1